MKSEIILLFLSFFCITQGYSVSDQIDRTACEQVLQQLQLQDINYVPDVDTQGQSLMPATLEPNLKIPSEINIPLTLKKPFGDYNEHLEVGTLKINTKDHTVVFNDQSIEFNDTEALRQYCLKKVMHDNE